MSNLAYWNTRKGTTAESGEILSWFGCGLIVPLHARAAERSVSAVNGLQDIKVKLLPRGHANVETVFLNRIVNLLRIGLQHGLRPGKRRVVERGAVDGAEDRLLLFRQGTGRTREESCGKQFDVCQIIGLDDFATQTGAAVGNSPAALIGVVVKLAVQGDSLELHFFAVLPDQSPACRGRDAVALPVGLGHAMNFCAGGND